MKKAGLMVLVLCLGVFGLFRSVASAGATGGTPDVFCKVVNEPDPALLGAWECIAKRQLESGGIDTDQVSYRLIKDGGRYALYFDRITHSGKKRYVGWRDWTIDGKEIVSGTGVKIRASGNEVFYIWKDGAPQKMTRAQ